MNRPVRFSAALAPKQRISTSLWLLFAGVVVAALFGSIVWGVLHR